MNDVPKVQLAEGLVAVRAGQGVSGAIPFAPQAMPAQPSFAPQVMGSPPARAFAPQVMGQAPVTPFAPQAMAPAPQAPAFAPQVMGTAPVSPAPYAPPAAMPPAAAAPSHEAFAPGAPAGGAQVEPEDDGGLAASPWNTANSPSFNRDLLPSAMLAPAPTPEPTAKPTGRAGAVDAGASRGPWIIVGALVLIALAGAIAVVKFSRRTTSSGVIVVTAAPGVPEEPTADSATAATSSSATPSSVQRPLPPRPRLPPDDPRLDGYRKPRPAGITPPSPMPASPPVSPPPATPPQAAPRRLFGVEN